MRLDWDRVHREDKYARGIRSEERFRAETGAWFAGSAASTFRDDRARGTVEARSVAGAPFWQLDASRRRSLQSRPVIGETVRGAMHPVVLKSWARFERGVARETLLLPHGQTLIVCDDGRDRFALVGPSRGGLDVAILDHRPGRAAPHVAGPGYEYDLCSQLPVAGKWWVRRFERHDYQGAATELRERIEHDWGLLRPDGLRYFVKAL